MTGRRLKRWLGTHSFCNRRQFVARQFDESRVDDVSRFLNGRRTRSLCFAFTGGSVVLRPSPAAWLLALMIGGTHHETLDARALKALDVGFA
jgi:hypothetical protein